VRVNVSADERQQDRTLLLFETATNLKKIPSGSDVMQAGFSAIRSAAVVRDLRVLLDAQLSMREHISRTAQDCFFHLRRLRSIRQLLGHDVTLKLVVVYLSFATRLLQRRAGRSSGCYNIYYSCSEFSTPLLGW
jgi:hypothetical protein